MRFVKYLPFCTACITILTATGCVTTETPFDHSEAVKARVNLALAYLEQQDYPKAKENIDKALAHNNQDYLPYSALAYYYQQTDDVANAQSAYQTAIKLSQARPDVLNNYGTFLCKQGQYQHAFAHFEQALNSSQPYYHQADTLENIILCAKQSGDLERKQQALMQLRTLDEKRTNRLE